MPNPLIEKLNQLLKDADSLIFAAGHETYRMSDENLPPKALALAMKHCIAQLRKVAP